MIPPPTCALLYGTPSHRVQECVKVVRERSNTFHPRAGAGMGKGKLPGVQEVTRDLPSGFPFSPPPVELITDHGMTDGGHVNPDLMCTACRRYHLD